MLSIYTTLPATNLFVQKWYSLEVRELTIVLDVMWSSVHRRSFAIAKTLFSLHSNSDTCSNLDSKASMYNHKMKVEIDHA